MNIFKALSEGNGTITETNFTSFLSYLLNNNKEIGNTFFLLFIEALKSNFNGSNILELIGDTFREKLYSYERNYNHLAIPEFTVSNNNRKQIIDIFLKISDKEENDIAYLLIENKLKISSRNERQCTMQYETFINSEDYQNDIPIYNILITTDSESFRSMYEESKNCNPKSIWLKWTNRNVTEMSVEKCLIKLFALEVNVDISPIENSSLFILKSFVDYVSSEYSYRERRNNYSIAGFDVIESADVELDNNKYILNRYENKMIRLLDEESNLLDVEVKPILRQINHKYQLNVDLNSRSGRKKNTQILGRDIIYKLNNQ